MNTEFPNGKSRTGFPIDHARVKAVVFDLGGVILDGGPGTVRAFGGKIGLSPPVWHRIMQELFIEGDLWDSVERGERPIREFAEALSQRVANEGVRLTVEEAANFMGVPGDPGQFPLRQPLVEIIEKLNKVLPVALLTNNVLEWREGWRKRLAVEELFQVVVDSCEEGCRKPEERIYRIMEQRLGLPGEALLFVDDLGVNLKTARLLNWQTLKFETLEPVLGALEGLLDSRD